MRTSSLVAGSLGITLVGGGLLVLTVIGVVALVALAPAADDGSAVRDALVDAKDELAWCTLSSGARLPPRVAVHDMVCTRRVCLFGRLNPPACKP